MLPEISLVNILRLSVLLIDIIMGMGIISNFFWQIPLYFYCQDGNKNCDQDGTKKIEKAPVLNG